MKTSRVLYLVAAATLLMAVASAQRTARTVNLGPALSPEMAELRAQRLASLPDSKEVLLHTELSARTIPPGGPLWAAFEIRNVSPRESTLWVAVSTGANLEIEVTTLAGEPVAPIPEASTANRMGRTGSVALLPGQSAMAVRDIGREFDITQPGTYVLSATQYVASGAARAVPVVFSVVAGAQPDARAAAAPDPNRVAADAISSALAANAPFEVSGPDAHPMIAMNASIDLNLTVTNRAQSKMRFGFENFIRVEVTYPDGRTQQIFNRQGDRDWNDLFLLSYLEPGASDVLKVTVNDRFKFPAPGEYTLRFFFPSATGPYEVPVTVTPEPVARAAR